ncbi:MAG: AAA family ATPase [Prevotella sp.]|nr:AAA family ATPase [Prevotella sp.]
MRIIRLHILSDYRNLKGLELKFDDKTNTNVIIGNNGSGKSNILEALSSIFSNLYADKPTFDFSFFLQYEIDNNIVKISFNKDKNTFSCKVNDKVVSSMDQYVPSRVVCNYSGEDMRLYDEYYKDAFEEYTNDVIRNEAYNPLRMIFIGRNLWSVVLLVMLFYKEDDGYSSFRSFLKKVIGFERLDRIVFKPNNQVLKRWVKENAMSVYFKNLISHCNKSNEIDLKYFDEFDNFTPMSMFFTLLGCKKAIEELSIYYNGGINAKLLSEGEKKFMVIQFILEALSDERTLVLMDEPDSHIHVSRKQELCDVFKSIDNRDNIITSHSPTLTAKFDKKAIVMLESDENGLTHVINEDKKSIVERLTDKMWTLQEQNLFLTSNKDILLVEGVTDISYLKAALKVLHDQGMFKSLDFEYIPCSGASNLKNFNDKFLPKEGQTIIAIWDYDDAGKKAQEELFKKKKDHGKSITSGNFGKARKLDNIWYTFYPKVRGIKDFNVEDYFPRKCKMHYVMSGRSINDICSKETLKQHLSKDCDEGKVSPDNFKNFSKVFSLFEDILQAEKEGKTEI